jgi:hypothetical protein
MAQDGQTAACTFTDLLQAVHEWRSIERIHATRYFTERLVRACSQLQAL